MMLICIHYLVSIIRNVLILLGGIHILISIKSLLSRREIILLVGIHILISIGILLSRREILILLISILFLMKWS